MHQYRRLRTKNLLVPLNQSDLNENERGEGEPGEGSSHGGIETAMILSTVVETSEGGETGQLTDLVNPSSIDNLSTQKPTKHMQKKVKKNHKIQVRKMKNPEKKKTNPEKERKWNPKKMTSKLKTQSRRIPKHRFSTTT
ncbi:hypothetical protein F2Q69_00035990 [Brassica cretica]|uniref:Uncharacterized protein n=1 Tax=Brassica cretica TaxID=69181 RepID=A0A8S9SHQ5_BRACR|nr:hypothetical protein F2Q69_00035990 [Brassica cretica]